jgi:hypothetical protein
VKTDKIADAGEVICVGGWRDDVVGGMGWAG